MQCEVLNQHAICNLAQFRNSAISTRGSRTRLQMQSQMVQGLGWRTCSAADENSS